MSACKLLRKPQVIDYLRIMEERTNTKTVKTILERKEMLSRIMDRTEIDCPPDAIRASAELSKMDGGYEPERQEMDINITIGGNAEA